MSLETVIKCDFHGQGCVDHITNNGKELINEEVIRFCKAEGITIRVTAPYSPSQNRVAERFNHTLIELIHAMLIAKGLPTFLWDEAVSHAHATYIWN